MRDFWASCLQCAIAIACGAPVWFWTADMEREARFIGTLAAGFGGLWLCMKLYGWLRYGRGTRTTMD